MTPNDYRSGFDADDFRRLRHLKFHFDPASMFRVNHNIPAAGT